MSSAGITSSGLWTISGMTGPLTWWWWTSFPASKITRQKDSSPLEVSGSTSRILSRSKVSYAFCAFTSSLIYLTSSIRSGTHRKDGGAYGNSCTKRADGSVVTDISSGWRETSGKNDHGIQEQLFYAGVTECDDYFFLCGIRFDQFPESLDLAVMNDARLPFFHMLSIRKHFLHWGLRELLHQTG